MAVATLLAARGTIRYHDSKALVILINSLHIADYVPKRSDYRPAKTLVGPRANLRNLVLVLALVAFASMVLAACTSGSNLRDTTSGWSPVAAIPVPLDTGGRITEGRAVDPLDNTLTVSNPSDFAVGQVLQIDDERLQITAIRDKDLTVLRGFDDTTPQSHADLATIYTIGEQFVVVISTKDGEIIALDDHGSGAPAVKWSDRQSEAQR